MASQWHNFLRNLGEWRGSFTSLDREGVVTGSTASILSLEDLAGSGDAAPAGAGAGVEERLVRFRLRRFADGLDQPPSHTVEQDYRSLGRQVVFFDTGSFAKGSLQVAPATPFGAEFGFVAGDRRHRLVQLFDAAGNFDGLVLIREFRAGTDAAEQPPLTVEQISGEWRGQEASVTADWPEIETRDCQVRIEAPGAGEGRWLLLPDGGFSRSPEQVSHRAPFMVEAGWLRAPGRLELLRRRYDASGAWRSAHHLVLERA
ncbi:MAG: DUF3598 family protein [Cyanobium sp.]